MATPDIVEPDASVADPVIETYKKDIDVTLIDRCLRLTTEQRAQQLVNMVEFVRELRPLVADAQRSQR